MSELPSSYSTLFGSIDHADGNESRSVLSPAAYLVDMLMLTENAGYHARRPDVGEIKLDQANTFTELPQLEIAHAVMSALVNPSALSSSFPPPLPFSEQNLRLQLYAEKLGTSLDEIQRLYRASVDAMLSARLLLDLSEEEFALYASAHDSVNGVKDAWGADDTELAALLNGDVALIKQKLGLSLKQVKQLVRQDLSDAELDPASASPAANFYINQSPTYIVLDEQTSRLKLKDGSSLTRAHLDRMSRSVRLASRLSLELSDIDWLLQTACANTLDGNGLQAIAIALNIRKQHELAIDELCSLWAAIKSHGRGDGGVPADLFDRVHNNDFPLPLAQLVASLPNSQALDPRLQATLRVSGAEFEALQSGLAERGIARPPLDYARVVEYFAGCRRLVTLCQLLSLDMRELWSLIDVLAAHWAVSQNVELEIPLPFLDASTIPAPLASLFQPATPQRVTLDVLQKLLRVKAWLDAKELTARQLAFICLEDHADARDRLDDGSPVDDVQTDDAIETALDDVSQAAHAVLVAPSALQTGSLTPNGARAVFDALVRARILATFDDPTRALLRVEPREDEVATALQSGIEERLEIHESDLTALGITDIELAWSLLVARGYVDRRLDSEGEPHYFVAPGLQTYFSDAAHAASFTLPNYQAHVEALFAVLAQQAEAPQVPASAIVAAGIAAADVPALFTVLAAREYVEIVPSSNPVQYRVATTAKPFFADPSNLPKFTLPDFSSLFGVLAGKVEGWKRADSASQTDAEELGVRLSALADQHRRVWITNLTSLFGLAEDLTDIVGSWAFGTPDERPAQTFATASVALFTVKQRGQKALSDGFLASRFRRLQQLALLFRKLSVSADDARVYLTNQRVHERLPETLKLPAGFLSADNRIDALTALPNGDLLIVSKLRQAIFSHEDYRLLGTGQLDQIPGVTLPTAFRTRVLQDGFDAAYVDTIDHQQVLRLCAGDQCLTVHADGSSELTPLAELGVVRNNMRQNQHIDAAVERDDGVLYLFSGDQYYRYSQPTQLLSGQTFVDERYPKSIRGKFAAEGVSALPAAMFSKIDAAFRDGDGPGAKYYFFSGDQYIRSDEPYTLVKIRPTWGHVLNYLFEEDRVDAAFVLGNFTYLTRRNQLTRYTGPNYQIVDEGYPISFGNIPESELLLRVLRRFPSGLDAALAGRDGQLYAFKSGTYASSAAPDSSLTIRDRWGRVRNVFIDNQRVDGALFYNGALYLFCGDQYVRYSSPNYAFVDEGYPKRVRPNWNAIEHIGTVPDGLPLPVTAVAIGRTPTGTTDDVYFFGGSQYANTSGALNDIKAHWARARNNIERNGIVDAALLDASGRMYLFSGDQFYRYTSPDQTFADETYPRRLTGNWAQEGTGYSLPDTFANGISAALRAPDARIFFFSGTNYARVDAAAVPPRAVTQDWALVRNWIQAQNRVNAAFVDPSGKTYLFGGDQFVRYSTSTYDFVDEGYPLAISTRWGNTPTAFRSDIDSALSFKSPVDNVQRLYVFKGDQYVRYSTTNYAQVDAGYPKRLRDGLSAEGSWFRGFALHELPPFPLPDDYIDAVEATYVDTYNNQPRINVFYRHSGAGQWRREYRNGTWQVPIRMDLVNDYLPFTRLDAAFVSADGTLHAFNADQYATRPPAGGAMTAPVQIRSRWSRVKNQFAELGRVDATLSMPDGRTYLFCATQFVKYTGALRPGDADFYVDEGYPKRIDPNWPAESVSIALVPELQATGYDLCRDASGKIHFFNGSRYNFSGNPGADLLLTSRWGKVDNHFQDLDRVDAAYRAENGRLYLFCDTQFTRYSGALQPGSADFYADEGYPRRVSAWWSAEGLPIALPAAWNALGSAIVRDAQQTYVFNGATFSSEQAPAAAPVIPQWAKVRNEMQTQNRVDAGFVLGSGASAVTLLFSADQYVRYSGTYDGFVDEGYPKVIAHLQAADGAFPGLPADLQAGLRAFFAGTDGALHVFGPQPADATAAQLYVSSANANVLRPLNERWGIVDNELWDREYVNAALRRSDGKLFLFSGDQYLRYSSTDRTNVDEGYPRAIASSYAAEAGVPAFSPVMNQGVGAALTIGTTTFYFAGDQAVSSAQPTVAQPLVERWGLVKNHLQTNLVLDAAFTAPNGVLYLFAGDQVSRYSGVDRTYVDEEYPRTIVNDVGAHWPATAPDFRSNLSAAAAFEGRSYLFKDGSHVRISDLRLEQPDHGYPLANASKFVDRFDFELGALPIYWQVKQLFDDYSSQTTTIRDYLDGLDFSDPKFADPELAANIGLVASQRVSALSRATEWSTGDIVALLTIFALDSAALLDARTLVALARCFELATRMGTSPQKLKADIWNRVFGPAPRTLADAADVMYGLIKAATSASDWVEVSRGLYDQVANAKRDALVAYLVDARGLQDENDLYEQLLTDVEMDASADTSRIVEAINSIQLFYHRALMRLEEVPDPARGHLKDWWPWMKNYRIWEANRKVFLYPENYLRPELRTEKSPAFEALEQKLLQDEITPISVREGYQEYLDSFHEIARLRIAGGYRYDLGTKTYVSMIGVSRAEPPVFYYRFGIIDNETQSSTPEEQRAIDWEPWQKIGITIDSDRVQPVYAFNRLFVFWIETKPYNAVSFSNKEGQTYSAESEEVKQVQLTVKYSFYNFNKEWVAPQALRLNPDDPADPEAFARFFSAAASREVLLSARNPTAPHDEELDTVLNEADEFIHLSFKYLFWEWPLGKLTDGLDLVGAPGRKTDAQFIGLGLVTESATQFPRQLGVDAADVTAMVPWGTGSSSHGSAWFSFDAKGGTFLCRPEGDAPTFDDDTILGEPFPFVRAVFSSNDGDVFAFSQEHRTARESLEFRKKVLTESTWRPAVNATSSDWPWGRPARMLQKKPSTSLQNVIVAADGGRTYFLLDDGYFTYTGAEYHATAEHFASELHPDAPSLDVLSSGATLLSWADSIAPGRSLVRAFRVPGESSAAIATDANGDRGVVPLTLDDLRTISADSNGDSPFDGWDRLDAVFEVDAPEPRAFFSRDAQLIILTWSSKSWSAETLVALPAGATRLSAAFSGRDGKLYWFSAGKYAEIDPSALTGSYTYAPIDPRWGRTPSLFAWKLNSIDGALFGPDGKLYLMSGDSCVRYAEFEDRTPDNWVLSPDDALPPKISDIWRSTTGKAPGIETVTTSFEFNDRTYLFGTHGFTILGITVPGFWPVVVRYSPGSRNEEGQFTADEGYPMLFLGVGTSMPAGFYEQLITADQQQYSITRLTSNTSEWFARRLFALGLPGLLSLETQRKPEVPMFTPEPPPPDPMPDPPPEPPQPGRDELFVNTTFVTAYPAADGGLDFDSANAFYYWEIFFHIPFLIAQTLKQEQRFQDALTWYEYVFDPTYERVFDPVGHPELVMRFWKFLEFTTDPELKELGIQIVASKDDPFDPHRLAEIRTIAYRKAFAMSYVDNLLEWADMLFRQYTRESIGEATMLYVRAADLLGKKPEELGKRLMPVPDTKSYTQIKNLQATTVTPELLLLENGIPSQTGQGTLPPTPNDSIFNPYFYIPENDQFVDYWDRVEDRLTKIRHGLNIDGVKVALSLFAPPVDVLALVRAFASGAGLAQALADYNAPVPHYRFTFLLNRARELTSRLTGLGSSLLSALEKRDAEELNLLRNTQEKAIYEMQLQIKEQQFDAAKQSVAALQEGLKNARLRETHYRSLINTGLSAHEQTQLSQMITGQVFSQVANVLGAAASVAAYIPQAGSPFAMTYGGIQLGSGVLALSHAFRAQAEMANFESSLAATLGGWERRGQDWELQKNLATGDTLQIERQIRAAEIQVEIANREIQVQRRLIKNNEAIDTFMKSKFTSQQLYQWMIGKLSAVYFQTYNLALQYAKAAQRAMQFELALPEGDETSLIGSGYWDSLRKGLTAGEQLQLDIDRLEKAQCDANQRRFEITRQVSLLQVDPLALVRLKERGRCEFELSESLFANDFPSHYCRQIKSVALTLPAIVGPYRNINATLTQLGHRTLLAATKQAATYLLNGTGNTPEADVLRVDWRPNQQVALSTGVNDAGLFQLNYADERYLPFEGTGVVSTWRLEIGGVDGPLHLNTLSDVVMTVQYTARQGGDAYGETVKKALAGKTVARAWLLNLATDYADAWHAFMNAPANGLAFSVARADLPGASERKVTGVYLHYDLLSSPEDDISKLTLTLRAPPNDVQLDQPRDRVQLKPGAFKERLTLPLLDRGQNPASATWRLTPSSAASASKFNPRNIKSIALVVTYAGKRT